MRFPVLTQLTLRYCGAQWDLHRQPWRTSPLQSDNHLQLACLGITRGCLHAPHRRVPGSPAPPRRTSRRWHRGTLPNCRCRCRVSRLTAGKERLREGHAQRRVDVFEAFLRSNTTAKSPGVPLTVIAVKSVTPAGTRTRVYSSYHQMF